jgi:HipA-like protein
MKAKNAEVCINGKPSGYLSKDNNQYTFYYTKNYLDDPTNPAISLSLPKKANPIFLINFFLSSMACWQKEIIKNYNAEL